MVANFTVFGCCASRDVFNSQINTDYKEFFKIGKDAFHMSMISMMSKPVSYDEELINHYVGEISDYNLGLIKKDFEKSFLDDLKNDNYEYLLLDTYFDVMHGVIRLNDQDTFITNTKFVHQTDFFKKTPNKNILTIKNNFREYLKLWMKSCDEFFEFVSENCPDMKIILNPVRSSTKSINNGEIIEHDNYKSFIPNRCYRSILDEYILNNFEVDALIYDKKHLLDDNHKFGAAEIHYGQSYFDDVTKQLNAIIARDNLEDSNLSYESENLKRKLLMFQFNNDIEENNKKTIFKIIEELNGENTESENSAKRLLDSNIINHWDKFLENGYNKYSQALNKYMSARLDIKNYGGPNNNVNVLEISDSDSLVLHPGWFKNQKGQGMLVQSEKGFLNMKLRCVNKGKLVIDFKGPDVKDKQKNQIPIYIDYTSLKINDHEFIDGHLFTHLKKSYEVSKEVEDSEIVEIKVKWMPLNSVALF